ILAILELEHIPTSTVIIFSGTHFKSKKAFVESRKNQAEAIVKLLLADYSDRSYLILAGGYNGGSDEPFYSVIRSMDLQSSY
ncbi:unnamed protein product, partial [Rotaria socialis]